MKVDRKTNQRTVTIVQMAEAQSSDERLEDWRRSIVVRTLVSAGELSLSCARLLAG